MEATTWERSPERPPDPDPPAPGSGADRWLPWTAPVGLVAALMIATVGGLVVAIAAIPFGYSFEDAGDTPPGVLLGATFVQGIGFVTVGILFGRMTGPVTAGQFGLRGTHPWKAIGWTLAAYGVFILFTALWSPLVGLGETEDQLDDLGVRDSDAALAFGAFLVCVVAPIVEEFFFRRFFFRALRNWKGFWPAALITGAAFGAIHFGSADAGALVPLAVFGAALCWLYERTGSLYPCIALHAINNSIAFSVALDWSWQLPLVLAGSLCACALLVVLGSRLFPSRQAVV